MFTLPVRVANFNPRLLLAELAAKPLGEPANATTYPAD